MFITPLPLHPPKPQFLQQQQQPSSPMAVPFPSNSGAVPFLLLALAGIVLLLLAVAPAAPPPAASTSVAAAVGLRASFVRADPRPTNQTLAALQSRHRAALVSGGAAASSSAQWAYGEFVMPLLVGTPGIPMLAVVDTASDLTWVKCHPCVSCGGSSSPPFNSSASSTFAPVGCPSASCSALDPSFLSICEADECGYIYRFAGEPADPHHVALGFIVQDSISLSGPSVARASFGCSHTVAGLGQYDGVAGLGRGNLSLVRQLGATRFSYCLANAVPPKPTPLYFGALAALDAGAGAVHTIPFVADAPNPSYYYVDLVGISVGGRRVGFPAGTFAINRTDGSGGVIVNSAVTMTLLEPSAYLAVASAIKEHVGAAGLVGGYGYEICIGSPQHAPAMALHFGGGAEMALGVEEYFQEAAGGVHCLMLTYSPSRMSVIGNIIQMNKRMLFDLEGGTLSWQNADCAAEAAGGDGVAEL